MLKWKEFTLSGRFYNHLHLPKITPWLLLQIFICMIFDISLYFGLTILIYYLIAWRMMVPAERGFYCHDESIRQPLYENTVPTLTLLAVTLGSPFLFILSGNALAKGGPQNRERIAEVVQCSTYIYLDYVLGFWSMTLILDVIKCMVGRLRPNFLAMCKPDPATYQPVCALNSTAYIEQVTCTSGWKKSRNSRMSFPSGHAAAAVFALLFLYFFSNQIHKRTPNKCINVFRTVTIFLFTAFCIFCCLSRVSDCWHHVSDVLGGAVTATIIFQIFLKKYKSDIKPL